MPPRRDFPRQSAVNRNVVEDLTGRNGSAVAAMVSDELRQEQERQRKHPVRPAERKRGPRKVTVTFSDVCVVERLRDLAGRWGLVQPGGPNVSAVVEYLLLFQLDAAERGEIQGPGMWR